MSAGVHARGSEIGVEWLEDWRLRTFGRNLLWPRSLSTMRVHVVVLATSSSTTLAAHLILEERWVEMTSVVVEAT